MKNFHFFNKTKITQINLRIQIEFIPNITQPITLHHMMRNTILKIINDSIQTKNSTLGALIDQIFSNHIHETNKYDKQGINQSCTLIFLNHKIRTIHNFTNQLECKITANVYESIPNGWILKIIK